MYWHYIRTYNWRYLEYLRETRAHHQGISRNNGFLNKLCEKLHSARSTIDKISEKIYDRIRHVYAFSVGIN